MFEDFEFLFGISFLLELDLFNVFFEDDFGFEIFELFPDFLYFEIFSLGSVL